MFIARQFVSYTWVVQQTTTQDPYQIQLQTTFQTDVPAPVLTITAPPEVPNLQPGQSASFNDTLTNHGLIAAQGVTLTLPTDPDNTFTTLTTSIGVVPAESSVVVPIIVTRNVGEQLTANQTCVDTLSAYDFYYCDGEEIGAVEPVTMAKAAAICDAADWANAILDALGSIFGGLGNGVATAAYYATTSPGYYNPYSCLEAIMNKIDPPLTITAGAASDPPIDTAPPVDGHGPRGRRRRPGRQHVAVTFIATALGNLGLLAGQRGTTATRRHRPRRWSRRSRPMTRWRPTWLASSRRRRARPPASASSGDITLLQQVDARMKAVTTAENLLFGGDANWLNTNQPTTLEQWMTAFFTDAQSIDGGGTITAAETTQLLATTLPSSVTTAEATEFIDRWNRSVQYWSQGIFTAAQVPAGQSTDFLDLGAIQSAFNAANTAEQESQVDGYSDPDAEVDRGDKRRSRTTCRPGVLRDGQAPDRPDGDAHPHRPSAAR